MKWGFLGQWLITVVIGSAALTAGAADLAPADAARSITSAWLVRVDGEPKTRTFIVKSADLGLNGGSILDADYGLTDAGQSKVKAELVRRDNAYVLEFVTQAGTVVTVQGVGGDQLTGSFKYRTGKVSAVTLSRLSPEALERVTMQAVAAKFIPEMPSAPAACAGLIGAWAGTWTQGSRNAAKLWVVEADASCNVKYSSERIPKSFAVANASDGSLSFMCNSSTGGTCVYKRFGDDLYVNYSNLQGGINSAVLKRVGLEAK
jgi:hypothetical protein